MSHPGSKTVAGRKTVEGARLPAAAPTAETLSRDNRAETGPEKDIWRDTPDEEWEQMTVAELFAAAAD